MTSESRNNSISKAIAKLYLNAELADIVFVFKIDEETEKIPAHKNVLASFSPVFYAMFLGPIKETERVKIVDSSPEAFKEFLTFFYLEEVKLTMENMAEVVRLCDKYDMNEHLENYASSHIGQVAIEDICWAYQLAVLAKHDPLKSFCEKIICAFPDDVFKSESFLNCNREVLKQILQFEALPCKETEVFQACIAWVTHDCQQNGIEINSKNLKTQLGDCFYFIRFNTMSNDELVGHTLPFEEMFTRDDLVNILYSGAEKFIPNLFVEHPRLQSSLLLDENKLMICRRDLCTGGISSYQIQNTESMWFSTNTPLILGKLYCYGLRESSGYAVNHTFKVIVREVGAQSFDVIAPTKTIFKAKTVISGDKEIPVELDQPIIINPRKMYEVRLIATANVNNYSYQYSPRERECKLDENVTVKFHRNPSHDCQGLVSSLYFYQL
ncbi:BTB/POZ domain-containing protein 3-like [Bradysia coprophila]|uniref:BTB/POZ domain-containing protein 3-like n=1 Tax=Bradysia coprophila TaxID=38358 RepID=UPI00187DA075|nr:BTB/POZ domain-containing protein 3-like [Bradysia coprophila]